MRKRAIARIIVFSILGVLLTTILVAGLLRAWSTSGSESVLSELFSFAPIRKTIEITEKTILHLPVPKLRMFGCAPVITFENQDIGIENAAGYVPSGYVEGSGGYDTVPKQIDVDWASGHIYVITKADIDGVALYEYAGNVDPLTEGMSDSYAVSGSNCMIHRMSGNTLKIEQFRAGLTWIGTHNTYTKTLVVVLPEGCELNKLSFDAAAVEIELANLSVRTLDLDTASGSVTANNCAFDRMEVDTASTSLTFSECTANRIDVDCASGRLEFDLLNTPEKVDMDFASGSCLLRIPQDASFSVKFDSLSGDVAIRGFDITDQGNRRIVNGGNSTFDFDLMSGSITIEAREAAGENKF